MIDQEASPISPEAPRARTTSRFARGLVVGIMLGSIGTVGVQQLLSPDGPSETPPGAFLFERTTREGIRVRAHLVPSSFSSCREEPCSPCVVRGTMTASLNGGYVGTIAGSPFDSASDPPVLVNGPGGVSGSGLPGISLQMLHVNGDVARVTVRFGEGFIDSMAPTDGWALLAAYGISGPRTITAYDKSGVVIARDDGREWRGAQCTGSES